MCVSYGNLSKSLLTFENLVLKGHKTLLDIFVCCNLFCGLNPTKEACCIKLRGVWEENKYLGGIQTKPNGASRDFPRFEVFPLYLWRGKSPCLLPQLKRWGRWRSAKVSLLNTSLPGAQHGAVHSLQSGCETLDILSGWAQHLLGSG